MVGIRPKELIEPDYHDYLKNDHYREWMTHEHAMYVEQNDLILKKANKSKCLVIRAAPRWRQGTFLKPNNQVEYDVSSKYDIGRYQIKTESKDKQLQETDDKAFVRSIMT